MAGQTLETNILINATIGNGFSEIGSTLTQLGMQIEQMSRHLREFGGDSLNTYRDYEQNMREAEIALSTQYGRDSKALNEAMSQLDEMASYWASTTIFHTDDVSAAINQAAHASWNLDEIMTGLPAAMKLAQLGNIDLADAVYYVTKAQKALGIEFEDLPDFIDMWAYAANSSTGDVETFGDAILKLGSTGRFADNQAELLSMIGLMHDFGTSGAEAATLLRTSMMRLIAPSGVTKSVLAQLGATPEEMEAVREDTAKVAAMNELYARGFSAFDEQGQLKPMLQVYEDLGTALADIAGGYELIGENETTLGILGAVFGNRGITGALNLINGLQRANELYGDLESGMAGGYGSYGAEAMLDTLYGSMEIFQSKVEELQRRTGSVLSDQVRPLLDTLGGIVDTISGLDEGQFTALVDMAGALALAGPGLLIAGAAFKMIGFAMTPIGAATLGLIAFAGAVKAIGDLKDIDFKNQFGDLSLDKSEVTSYVQQLAADFDTAYQNVNAFAAALDTAVASYNTASSTFKADLITAMLTSTDVSEGSEAYVNLMNLGGQIFNSLVDGIINAGSERKAGILESLTGENGGNMDAADPLIGQIMDVLQAGFNQDIETAAALSQQLRKAMTSAFADGSLTGEEIANIQSILDQMNELMAQQENRENYLARQRLHRKAQSLGLDSIRELSSEVEEERNAEWEQMLDRQAGDYYDLNHYYDEAIASGLIITDAEGNQRAVTEADRQSALAALASSQKREQYAFTAGLSNFLLDLWSTGIESSDLAGGWMAALGLADSFRAAGGYNTKGAVDAYTSEVTPTQAEQIFSYVTEMVESMGGAAALQGYADFFAETGDELTAQRYNQILDLYNALSMGDYGMPIEGGAPYAGDYSAMQGTYAQIQQLLSGAEYKVAATPEELYDYMASQQAQGLEPDWSSYLGPGLAEQFQAAASASGMTISGMISSAVQTNAAAQTASVNVEGDTNSLAAQIEAQDGRTLTEYVTGDTSGLQSAINSLRNQTIPVRVQRAFASGGRATEASVFGEAGPEWAIPEEHSARTAELLDEARAASGFTWPELLARNGGLNSGTGSGNTLIYSPTINAQNADGVEEALRSDKQRMERWYEEKQMRDRVEVYA